jgi:hypothetical protein
VRFSVVKFGALSWLEEQRGRSKRTASPGRLPTAQNVTTAIEPISGPVLPSHAICYNLCLLAERE